VLLLLVEWALLFLFFCFLSSLVLFLLYPSCSTFPLEKLPRLYLHAQLTALPFYSGLGFTCYGEEFMDADMPHIAMQLNLT